MAIEVVGGEVGQDGDVDGRIDVGEIVELEARELEDDDVHRTVIDPLNPNQMYITTGIGMYVSANGGETWEQWTDLQHEIGGYPDLLVLHPRQPELMFVASARKGPGS